MKHRKFDLETELRTGRAAPRGEFTQGLVDEVRNSGPARSPMTRVGLALALSGLIVVALASFGGIGYASSSATHAAKKPAKVVVKTSAAHAQYAPFTPPAKPKAPFTPPSQPTGGAAGTESTSAPFTPPAAPQVKSAELPFTGLALWVPLAFGLAIVSIGLVLRTRGRRRDATH